MKLIIISLLSQEYKENRTPIKNYQKNIGNLETK